MDLTESPEPNDAAADPTIAEFLEGWLQSLKADAKPSTWRTYRWTISRYVNAHIGDVPVSEVDAGTLTRLHGDLLAGGGLGGVPLSWRTVESVHSTLRRALDQAEQLGLLAENPARTVKVDPPDGAAREPAHRDRPVWTAAQLRTFLDHSRDHRHGDLWLVAAMTGMRTAELLGLGWNDVALDSDQPTLTVGRTLTVFAGRPQLTEPVTARARTLHIDPVTVDALRRQRARQEQLADERGPCWDNPWNLVFTARSGCHLRPNSVANAFHAATQAAPVPPLRLPQLRDVHATLLLRAGVATRVVSHRLGHSSTQLTMEHYAHVVPTTDLEAVRVLVRQIFTGDDCPPQGQLGHDVHLDPPQEGSRTRRPG